MKEWSGRLNMTESYQWIDTVPMEQVLLFDIETTGFSAKNTYCYMIGFCYMQDGVWYYRMLFNNDGRSEAGMLDEFFSVLENYRVLLHYNGDGFDIPYLKEKLAQYTSLGFPFSHNHSFDHVQSIDLYKIIKPYKKELHLPNLKLPTIQAAMNITRQDMYNGGELIKVYHDYRNTHSVELEQHLYQHNYEDILAMIPLLQLLHYPMLKKDSIHVTSIEPVSEQSEFLRLTVVLDYKLPIRYELERDGIHMELFDYQGSGTIPLSHMELKYYMENWKDYYYLPLEDTIIHKSVATYVDSAYKEKANKNNCYLKKEAIFLPLPFQSKEYPNLWTNENQTKVYKESIQQKDGYIEWEPSLYHNTDFFSAYIKQLI